MTQDSLFEQLKHPNPNLRDQAMFELAETRDENTVPRLMANLREEDVVYRRASVKTLGAIGLEALPDLVGALLNSENATVRGSCAKALAQIAVNHRDQPFPTEGILALRTALNDPHPVVNIASAMALGEVGVSALDTLIDALNTIDNPAVAVSLVNALGSIGDPRARETLASLAADSAADPYVQEVARSALSRSDLVEKFKSGTQE